jgi:hypothetical protein
MYSEKFCIGRGAQTVTFRYYLPNCVQVFTFMQLRHHNKNGDSPEGRKVGLYPTFHRDAAPYDGLWYALERKAELGHETAKDLGVGNSELVDDVEE